MVYLFSDAGQLPCVYNEMYGEVLLCVFVTFFRTLFFRLLFEFYIEPMFGSCRSSVTTTVADKQNQQTWYLGNQAKTRHSVSKILFKFLKYIEKDISEVFPSSGWKPPNLWPK